MKDTASSLGQRKAVELLAHASQSLALLTRPTARRNMKGAKCRSCQQLVDRDQAIRIGGNRHHEKCAERRLKARQHWDGTKWIKEGKSY